MSDITWPDNWTQEKYRRVWHKHCIRTNDLVERIKAMHLEKEEERVLHGAGVAIRSSRIV